MLIEKESLVPLGKPGLTSKNSGAMGLTVGREAIMPALWRGSLRYIGKPTKGFAEPICQGGQRSEK